MKNLPKNFSTWDHSAKCDFLIRTGQAQDFRHACQLLAKVPRNRGPRHQTFKPLNPVVAGQWFNRGQYA